MSDPEAPGSFGIDRLTAKVAALLRDVETNHNLIVKLGKEVDRLFDQLRRQLAAGLGRLERIEKHMGSQLDQMNEKLKNISDNETKLGTDIQQVVDYLKANPNPTDLGEQLTKLDQIGQKLIDTDATTLANLPPVPSPPNPTRRR